MTKMKGRMCRAFFQHSWQQEGALHPIQRMSTIQKQEYSDEKIIIAA